MQKILLSILIVVAVCIAGCTGKKETDKQPTSLQTLGLHGKVKRMTVIIESRLNPDRFSCDFRQTEDYRVEYEHAVFEGCDEFFDYENFIYEEGEGFDVEIYDFDEQGMDVCRHHYSGIPAQYFSGDNYLSKELNYYDESNNLVLTEEYDENDSLTGKSNYVFDQDGKLIKEIWWGDKGNMIMTTDYKYDLCGNQTERTEYYNDTLRYSYLSQYDKKGNKTKYEAIPAAESGSSWKYEYKYDDKGNLIEENYFSKGKKTHRTVYAYNANQQLESKTFYDHNCLYDYSTYQYDKWGNECYTEYYQAHDMKKPVYTIVKEYDEEGHLLFEEYLSEDTHSLETADYDNNILLTKEYRHLCIATKFDTHSEVTYNSNGDVTEEREYKRYAGDTDKDGQEMPETFVSHVVYKFDDHDNWTSRTDYVVNQDGTETAVVQIVRCFEYYE